MAFYYPGDPHLNYGSRPHHGDAYPGISQGDLGERIELEGAPSFEAHHVHLTEHFEPEEIKAQNKHLVSRDNKANLHLNIQPTQRQAEYFSTYRNIADDVSHAEFHPMQDSHSSVAQFDRYPMRSYSMNVTSAEPAPRVILRQIAAQPEPEELPMDWTVASNAAYCSDELDEPSGIDLTDFVSLHDMMAVRQKLDADLGLIPPKYMGTRSRGIPQLSLENESLCTTNYSSVKRRGLKGVWRQLRDTFRRR